MGKIEAAIEAPFVGGKLAVGVLEIARTAGAADGVLDVAEVRVDPLKQGVLRLSAAGSYRDMAHASLLQPEEAGERVAQTPMTGRRCWPWRTA